MLVQLFSIISLSVFLILVLAGSAIEPAILKSASVFIALVAGTRFSSIILDIIKKPSNNNPKSHSSHA